jgi:hypothetical protein
MSRTTHLRHVSTQFATMTVDPTGQRDRTPPAQKSTVNTAVHGSRPMNTHKADVTQQIAPQHLALVGK